MMGWPAAAAAAAASCVGAHLVVKVLHPLNVRAEMGAAPQVQGQMHPQAARLGQGVYQAREWACVSEAEVVSCVWGIQTL